MPRPLAAPRGSFHIHGHIGLENVLRRAAAEFRQPIGTLHDLGTALVLLHLRRLDDETIGSIPPQERWLHYQLGKAIADAWRIIEADKRKAKKPKPAKADS